MNDNSVKHKIKWNFIQMYEKDSSELKKKKCKPKRKELS